MRRLTSMRARRGGVDDLAQRRHVVLRACIVLGQGEQAVEHGRHHVARRDLVALDAVERVLGRPLVHAARAVWPMWSDAEPKFRTAVWYSGAATRCTSLSCGSMLEQVEQERVQLGVGVGVEVDQRPAHALGPAGRARRVVHDRPAVRSSGSASAGPSSARRRPEAVDLAADREAPVGGEVDLVGRGLARSAKRSWAMNTLASQSWTM